MRTIISLLFIVSALNFTLRAQEPEIEVEVKYLIHQDDTAAAMTKLTPLLKSPPLLQRVCFFDSVPTSLQSMGIILRAREKDGADDDSTLKLRTSGSGTVEGELAGKLPVEQDWTGDSTVNFSRSLDDKKLTEGLFEKVVSGAEAPSALFAKQLLLLKEQAAGFDVGALKPYGPITTKVWKKEFKLPEFDKKITTESWLLEKGGMKREILELSANIKGTTNDQIKQEIAEFYAAIATAKFGKSEDASKTRIVFEFFKPGS